MTKQEKLIDIGLSADEAKLLCAPITELSEIELRAALQAFDKRSELIREANKHHVSTFHYGANIISDDLGMQGVLNPVDGKKYDSRSAYHKAVKDAGCVVLGDEAPTQANTKIRGDFKTREALKKAAYETGYLN